MSESAYPLLFFSLIGQCISNKNDFPQKKVLFEGK